MNKLIKDIGTTLLGEIGLFILSFILGVITARVFGPVGKGELGIIVGSSGLLSIIFSGKFQRTITYFLASHKAKYNEIILPFIIIATLAISISYILFVYFSDFFAKYVYKNLDISFDLIFILMISNIFWSIIPSIYAGFGKFTSRSIFFFVSYAIKVIITLILLFIYEFNVIAYITYLTMLEIVIYFIWFINLNHKKITLTLNIPKFISMCKYNLLGYFGVITDLITLRIDIFFLNYFSGLAQVGVYTLSVSLANFLSYIPTAIKSVLLPYIANENQFTQSSSKITIKITQISFLMLISIGLILFLLINFFLIPIYGINFQESIKLFAILIPGTIFWGEYSILAADLEGRNMPIVVSICSFIGGFITIILDILLIPAFGATGAALASSIAYFFSFLILSIIFSKITKEKFAYILFPSLETIKITKRILMDFLYNLKVNKYG